MVEIKRIEIIPGVMSDFTETGIDGDVINAWMLNYACALNGRFYQLSPVQRYDEYFKEQDRKYAEAGKLGLLEATMAKSNPETVAAFDQLVDEFNTRLPQIIEGKDVNAINEYVVRAEDLKRNRAKP